LYSFDAVLDYLPQPKHMGRKGGMEGGMEEMATAENQAQSTSGFN